MALMGKNNNRSAIDDDASLFQVPEAKSEKQKWSQMNTHQRLQYFRDYYLIKCLICIAAAGITAAVLWSTLRPQKERVLFIAVVQDYLTPQDKAQLKEQLEQKLVLDADRQEVQIDDVFPNGHESNAKLSTYLGAQEIDLIITNEDRFQELAEAGCFEDLNIYLPDFAKENADLLCWSSGSSSENALTEDVNQDRPDLEESTLAGQVPAQTGPENKTAAYGIYLPDINLIQSNSDTDLGTVAGIVKGSLNKENAAAALIDVFFEE